MWRKENASVLLVGMYIDAAIMKNSMEIPQNIKNRATIQSSNSTPGYEENENANSKIYM